MASGSDPTIVCPNCKAEVRLTESLAAPIVESTRRQFEERLKAERSAIAEAEAKRARATLEADLAGKDRSIAELTETLKGLNAKLASAQKAEAELLRKQRELEDARREVDLTVEKRVKSGVFSPTSVRIFARVYLASDLVSSK